MSSWMWRFGSQAGGNAQGRRFIVVRDPEVKRTRGTEVRKGTGWKITVDELRIAAARRAGDISGEDEARARRGLDVFERFGEHSRKGMWPL